jgi:hypothetical protein
MAGSRHLILLCSLVGWTVWPAVAWADGLYLRVSCQKTRVRVGQAFDITVTAVATRSFTLPSAPDVLVDRDEGLKPDARTQCGLAESPTLRLTPGRAFRGSCQLALSEPGTYRIRLRYRLPDRVIDSNKLSVTVLTQGTEGSR